MEKILSAIGLAMLAQLAQVAHAKTLDGVLLSAGGIDFLAITIVASDGKQYTGYCDGDCGDLVDQPDPDRPSKIKPGLGKRKVRVIMVREVNGNRIPGPGADEKLNFIKKLEFIK